jgi:hypothetical protein
MLALAPAGFATDWAVDPSMNIQAVVDQAAAGDRLLLAAGTYNQTFDIQDKALEILNAGGPGSVILDGTGIDDSILRIDGPGSLVTVRGLTFTQGAGAPVGSSWGTDRYGAGMRIDAQATVLIEDCLFHDNGWGDGTNAGSCTFGGAFFAGSSGTSVTARRCTMTRNRAWASGGATMGAGGAYVLLENCTYYDNVSTNFLGNQGGHGLHVGSHADVRNCIFRNNTGTQVGCFQGYCGGTSFDIQYSNIQGGAPGAGNIDADPLFVDPTNLDFALSSGSPSIDAGDPSAPLDCDGTVADQGAVGPACSTDCNGNGVSDSDDIAADPSLDCNGNGLIDSCEIASGLVLDCNGNGIPDSCEASMDPALDLDGNGILDSCEALNVVWVQSPVSGRFHTALPPMTWDEAEAIAVSYGGHLATLRSQEENDWIASIFGHDRAWIGLNDLAVEGSFEWSSGEPVTFANWAPGSPGGFTPDQDRVAIAGSTGTWEDWFANTVYPAIVEVDGADCDADTRPDAFEIATAPENDWNGDGVLDVCVPANYCVGAPNSAGPEGGAMAISGSPVLADDDVELRATGLPGNQWSFFIMSQSQASIPGFGGSQGTLCLGAPLYRFNRAALGEIALTTPLGVRSLVLQVNNLPQGQNFLPGETWNFQLWYRDQNPGQTSNTTDGISVMFR